MILQTINRAKELAKQAKETIQSVRLPVLPRATERKKATNDKILESLQKVGVATDDEVKSLEARVTALEAKVRLLAAEKAVATPKKKTSAKATEKTANA